MLGPGGRKEVAVMAWPLAVGMISYTLMGLVDTLLIGRVSTAAQAGVGLASTFVFVAIAFCRGLSSGAQAPAKSDGCLLYTSPSPRDATLSRMPSSA